VILERTMEEISFREYFKIVMHRKGTVAVSMIAAFVITALVVAVMPRTYEGKTVLLFPEKSMSGITPQISQIMSVMMPGVSAPAFSGRETYTSILQSRTISDNVCKRLGLDRYGLDYEDLQGALKLEATKEGSLEMTFPAPTSWLKGFVPGNELKKRTAQLSADVANTYADELTRYDRSNIHFMSRKSRVYIDSQVLRTRANLTAMEAKLKVFQQAHPTLIAPDKSDMYADEMLKLVEKQVEADVAFREADSQLKKAQSTWRAGAPKGMSPESLLDSQVLTELRTSLSKLQVQRSTLLESFTENHPDVVSLNQQIQKTQAEISAEASRIVHGKAGSLAPAHQELIKQLVVLEITRDGMEAGRTTINNALQDIERKLSYLPEAEMEYARLLRDVKTTETIYVSLLAEQAKARIAEGRDTDNFVVLDSAVVPKKPAKPRVMLSLAMALVLGAMFGVLMAALQGMPPCQQTK
jgi:polysaccharide biosynthesis transport protein